MIIFNLWKLQQHDSVYAFDTSASSAGWTSDGTGENESRAAANKDQISVSLAYEEMKHALHKGLHARFMSFAEARAQGLSHVLSKAKRSNDAPNRDYDAAVHTCDNEKYFQYSISQIADRFHVNEVELSNQLFIYYPNILERRQRARERMGLVDSCALGAREKCVRHYASAVELLKTTSLSEREAAARCNVSYPGLCRCVKVYHKDLYYNDSTADRETPSPGKASQGGRTKEQCYELALDLYRSTTLPLDEIASRTGISTSELQQYISIWAPKPTVRRFLSEHAARLTSARHDHS